MGLPESHVWIKMSHSQLILATEVTGFMNITVQSGTIHVADYVRMMHEGG